MPAHGARKPIQRTVVPVKLNRARAPCDRLNEAEVAALPAASRAMAVSVWEPGAAVVVSQETLYGLAVTSAPRFTPSSLNWTPTTPVLSEALALTVVVPLTVAPLIGAVIATVGAALSTVTVTALLVVVLPAASRATALRVWEPSLAVVVFQEML